MSEIAIRCEGLSKQYRIGEPERYRALRDVITHASTAHLQRLLSVLSTSNGKSPLSSQQRGRNTFLALDNVSFEVRRGEVIAIIGRNGAGKSTLLKILARITKPTYGLAVIRGRVGSLLEVGTGFHPELSGRENIFLNGAILGMRKAEIDRKFDQIVAFAEVERFIDTPVKRFSSGMYMRLAFAVAAHLDPEILLVDEVLAVGDAAFQQKCLGKMGEISRQGRTVLFVTHNMSAVKSLCNRAILLQSGSLAAEGDVDSVVDSYLGAGEEVSGAALIPDDAPRLYSTGEAKIRSIHLSDGAGRQVSQLYLGQSFRVTVAFEVISEIREAFIELAITATDGTLVTNSTSIDGGNPPVLLRRGIHEVTLDIDTVLMPRRYSFLIGLHHFNGTTIDWIERALSFSVLNVAENGGDNYRWIRGYVRPAARWSIKNLNEES